MNIDALISEKAKAIQPSPIRRFFDLANAMEGTVSLGIGEPDFVTPWHIRDAALASLRAGETAYTPNAGTPQLRQAVADYLYARFGLSYDPKTDFLGLGNPAFVEGDQSEIDKLDKFLDKAYSFMLFVDADTPELPVLEEYMEEWGITVGRAENAEGELDNLLIRDQQSKLDKDGYTPMAEYVTAGGGASITEDMRKVAYPAKVVFPNAVAITMSESYKKTHVVPDETNGVTEAYTYGSYYRNGVTRYFHDVFKTSASAAVEAFGKQYQVATDLSRFNFMTLSIESRTVMETNYLSTQEPSYVAVFGSTKFASDTILDSAAYGNADVLTATLRHMGREVMPADLEFKAFKIFDVDTDVQPVNVGTEVLTTALMTLLPIALCTVIGVVIGIKRKYR